jgi:transcriptional regulator with XRE-family HTH domain
MTAKCSTDLLLGRLLALVRQMRGVSQGRLGDALGINSKTVGAWEAGRSGITLGMLDEIGAALGVPGVLLHLLHAQATVDLERKGRRVTGAHWRRDRGRGTKPSESEARAVELPKSELDRWLQEWTVEGIELDRPTILDVCLGQSWQPMRLEQRVTRPAPMTDSGEVEHHIISFELGLPEPLPWFAEQMEREALEDD